MSGNTYGKLFTVTTAGESHGPALVAIVDGCPPGLELSARDLQRDLDRRKPGTSRHTTQRQEADEVEILSGVFEGKTTGTPIGLLIRNTDQKSKDYSAIKDLFRPAHADYTYHHKYGVRDYRGGGRSSARETAMRVAAGAIAKKYLAGLGIQVRGYMSQLGPIEIPFRSWDSVEQNAFFSPDPDKVPELEAYMDQLRRDQDSVGAKITVVAEGVPPGLGIQVRGYMYRRRAGGHDHQGPSRPVRRHPRHADRRGDDGHRPARPVAAPAWAERRRARRHAGPAAAVRAVAGRGAGRVNGGS